MHNPGLTRLQVTRDEYKQQVKDNLAPHRLELLYAQAEWIRQTENWVGQYFISGADVDVNKIQPFLEMATTDRQHAIWRYCRLWGSIPYNKGVGRRIRYLLRDAGQPNQPVMGVISLCSPVVINKPRDEWIGWQYPDDVETKRRRLLNCMDLTVSMAIPPYNHLTAGKMICLAALSNEVRRDYSKKFSKKETPTGMRDGRLALITTTSLYGSSVQYNRLKVNDRAAYQLVGYTSGYGNAHITEAEFAKMERYLNKIGKPPAKGWGTGRSYRLRVAMAYYRNRHGTDIPPHENQRSVYVAPLAENAKTFLTEEDKKLVPYDWPFQHLADIWRKQWLERRINNSDVMARFGASNPFDQLLSAELE